MQVRNIVFGIIVVLLSSGCSFERQQVDYKAGAVQAQPLEVPPDLTVPEADQRYTIPGTEGEKAANYSEYSRKKAEQPCVNPAPVAPVAAAPAPAAKQIATLQDGKGGKRIQLDEPFDRSWRRIGLALDQARIAVTDKDRSKGIYFASVLAKDKKKTAEYQVILRETKTGSEVVVVNSAGKTDAGAAQLLDVVYQNLEEKNPAQGMPPSDGQFFGDAVRPLR
jgi:outer membrane protein assembly factor BamC